MRQSRQICSFHPGRNMSYNQASRVHRPQIKTEGLQAAADVSSHPRPPRSQIARLIGASAAHGGAAADDDAADDAAAAAAALAAAAADDAAAIASDALRQCELSSDRDPINQRTHEASRLTAVWYKLERHPSPPHPSNFPRPRLPVDNRRGTRSEAARSTAVCSKLKLRPK